MADSTEKPTSETTLKPSSEAESVLTSDASLEPTSKPVLKKIKLKTADDQFFDVDEAIAMEFQTVKSFIEDGCISDDTVTPLPNVSGWALAKIIEYCVKHIEINAKPKPMTYSDPDSKKYSSEVKAFEAKFLEGLSAEEIKELILAANYLNIKYMLDFLNQSVADRIKNKSVEYVRKFFGIESDFTAEEEAKLREDNSWAFEGVDED
ncbi:SKP1 [Quillaja saponaria]|uniref:SKP1-like protein n=1 Tax=Quillaja saponaria TaxID=32244 RepID=A0AAD7QIE6_QUISA|nr:SKP1 [Quillaja saponaria]